MINLSSISPHLIFYHKILDFFLEYPFETEYCGVTKEEALTIVQLYIFERGNDDIDILTYADFTTRRGTDFAQAYDFFQDQLKKAKAFISEKITEQQSQLSSISPSDFTKDIPLVFQQDQRLRSLFETYEKYAQKRTAKGNTWARANAAPSFSNPLKKPSGKRNQEAPRHPFFSIKEELEEILKKHGAIAFEHRSRKKQKKDQDVATGSILAKIKTSFFSHPDVQNLLSQIESQTSIETTVRRIGFSEEQTSLLFSQIQNLLLMGRKNPLFPVEQEIINLVNTDDFNRKVKEAFLASLEKEFAILSPDQITPEKITAIVKKQGFSSQKTEELISLISSLFSSSPATALSELSTTLDETSLGQDKRISLLAELKLQIISPSSPPPSPLQQAELAIIQLFTEEGAPREVIEVFDKAVMPPVLTDDSFDYASCTDEEIAKKLVQIYKKKVLEALISKTPEGGQTELLIPASNSTPQTLTLKSIVDLADKISRDFEEQQKQASKLTAVRIIQLLKQQAAIEQAQVIFTQTQEEIKQDIQRTFASISNLETNIKKALTTGLEEELALLQDEKQQKIIQLIRTKSESKQQKIKEELGQLNRINEEKQQESVNRILSELSKQIPNEKVKKEIAEIVTPIIINTLGKELEKYKKQVETLTFFSKINEVNFLTEIELSQKISKEKIAEIINQASTEVFQKEQEAVKEAIWNALKNQPELSPKRKKEIQQGVEKKISRENFVSFKIRNKIQKEIKDIKDNTVSLKKISEKLDVLTSPSVITGEISVVQKQIANEFSQAISHAQREAIIKGSETQEIELAIETALESAKKELFTKASRDWLAQTAQRGSFLQQQVVGGLWFSRAFAACQEACDAVPLPESAKSRIISQVVSETLARFLYEPSRPGGITAQEINSFLQTRLEQELKKNVKKGTPLVVRQIEQVDLTAEIQTLIAAEQTRSPEKGRSESFSLPIPGLCFFESFAKRQIVGSETLFYLLSQGDNVSKTLDSYSQRFVFAHFEGTDFYHKINSITDFFLSQLTGEEKKSLEKEFQQLSSRVPVDFFLQSLTIRILQIKDKDKQQEMLSTLEEAKKRLSHDKMQVIAWSFMVKENEEEVNEAEMQYFLRYLEKYQQFIIKHPSVGKWVHNFAKLSSMHKPNSKIFGFLPWAQWLMVGQYLKFGLEDPTLFPYVTIMASWSIVKMSVSLTVKRKTAEVIDKAANKIISLLGSSKIAIKTVDFVKNFFYIKSNGIITLFPLFSKHARKEISLKIIKNTAQKTINFTAKALARIAGKEVAKTTFNFLSNLIGTGIAGALGGLATGGVLGTLAGIWTAFSFIWDFILPSWLKKAIKTVVLGFLAFWYFLIFKLIGLVYAFLGPLGLSLFGAGFLLGGPLLALTLGGIGFIVGNGLFVLFGIKTFASPIFIQAVPGWGGLIPTFFQNIGNFFSSGGGFESLLNATSSPVLAQGLSTLAPEAIVGAGVTTAAVVMPTMIASVWQPLSPGQEGLQGQSSFLRVQKTAEPTNPSFCPDFASKKNCPNDIINHPESPISYKITIFNSSNQDLNNLSLTDEITVYTYKPEEKLKAPENRSGSNIENFSLDSNVSISIPFLSAGETKEVSYDLNINKDERFTDSWVFNTVKIVSGSEKTSASFVFSIGNPPPPSCPIIGGRVSTYSLGNSSHPEVGSNVVHHGSDRYYAGQTPCTINIPALASPIKVFYGSQRYPGISEFNQCYYNGSNPSMLSQTQDYFGFAADIVGSPQVFFPKIDGKSLIWKYIAATPNGVGGAGQNWGMNVYYQSDPVEGVAYKMFITHILDGSWATGGGHKSGEPMAVLCGEDVCNISPHLHIEIAKISGTTGEVEYLRPEEHLMCF